MAPAVEETYHDLLNPVKDPEKSFQVNIAALLLAYVRNFVDGKVPPNFNSAALLLQGSSSIYAKKVEYLHNLATQLYQNLSKQKKDDPAKKENNNKAKEKHKESKINDPFFSTVIKMGKNLSCLKKKNATTKTVTNRKNQKKVAKKHTFVPVDLLPFEGEEKGEIFYDTRGEAIGNKGDYTLNKCRVTTSGWLTLPTVSPDQVPTTNSPPDYSFNMELEDNHCDSDHDISHCSPDEGIDTGSEPVSQPTCSPECTFSQQTDEGLGSMSSTPSESTSSQQVSEPMEGIECAAGPAPGDINDIQTVVDDLDVASKSVRRSMRQPQQEEETPSTSVEENNNKEEELAVFKKAIQKKNTCNLPSKLGAVDNGYRREGVAEFCARTFFAVDNKYFKNGVCLIETLAFRRNSNFMKRLYERYEALKSATRKNKKVEEDEAVDIEAFNDPDPDDMMMIAPLEDEDIVIQNDLNELPVPDSGAPSRDISDSDALPPSLDDIVPVSEAVEKDLEEIKSHKELEKNAEIAVKVKDWQDRITPFLNELEHREAFDINLYGDRILNSFEQSAAGKQSRQTKTFRDFCKGMQKWQIHRYFMALLPLANIGNVILESEELPDGEEEILITLISKKMHHLRLEEFGNDPSCEH